jgi:hypothetical protein
MTEFLFPDNTVLCDFAAVDRLDLLRSILNERGRWTEAIAYEAGRSARHLPALAALIQNGWLGEPIEIIEDTDIQRIERIRRVVFGGTDDRPLQHLGEAQSCYVILNWAAFAGSWWITNDRDALRYARFQGITTRETVDLMSIAVANGDITPSAAFELMTRMIDAGRHLRLPRSAAELAR